MEDPSDPGTQAALGLGLALKKSSALRTYHQLISLVVLVHRQHQERLRGYLPTLYFSQLRVESSG